MSTPVCECPEPCACHAKGYTQGKGKAYLEMNNLDWTQHAKSSGCEGCTAFGKVLGRMLEHMATSENQETRLVGFHLTAWLDGTLNNASPSHIRPNQQDT